MGMQFFTGFEGVATDTGVRNFFPTNYLISYSATGGYNNGKCMKMANSTSYAIIPTSAEATKVAGWHARNIGQSEYSAGNGAMVVKFTGPDIRLFNTASGLQLYRGAVLIASVPAVISTDMQWLEAKLYSHASSGTFELRVNGMAVLSLTGANTGGANITAIHWGGIQTPVGASYYLDNIVIADNWTGERYSEIFVPTSDIIAGFAPSSGGACYPMIDEIGNDGDATYVSADTVGAKILCGFGDLPANIDILGVTRVIVGRKLDAGERIITPYAKLNGVDYPQSAISLGTTYPTANHAGIQFLPVAPDASAWSRDNLNATDWGAEITT